jgi:hypothetical protein
MPSPLYAPHPRALTVLHTEIEEVAFAQREAFVGTAGSVVERRNASGFRYYAHKFYDAEARPREHYVAGPVGTPEADAAAAELRARIADLKDLVPTLRLLGREAFSMVDADTYATLAALGNHGTFRAGAMLVGSHAYGILLNRLGVRAASYLTEDVDIARAAALELDPRPEGGLLAILRDTGIEFVEVPGLDRKQPATSFKKRGRARFHVDLLAPSPDESFSVVPVPELAAHATGLPLLAYLLAESQHGVALARAGCCAVRVPLPERFAIHKMLVSQLRSGRAAKSAKDLAQAAVLCAALADLHPGALEDARAAVPKRAAKRFAAALAAIRPAIATAAPRAWEELSGGT